MKFKKCRRNQIQSSSDVCVGEVREDVASDFSQRSPHCLSLFTHINFKLWRFSVKFGSDSFLFSLQAKDSKFWLFTELRDLFSKRQIFFKLPNILQILDSKFRLKNYIFFFCCEFGCIRWPELKPIVKVSFFCDDEVKPPWTLSSLVAHR